jgi:integrase
MVKVNLKGIHRVRKRLADGTRVEYHYAYRGGPCIWRTGCDYAVGSIEYIQGYQKAQKVERDDQNTFSHVIEQFLSSRDFKDLAPRTQKDHKKNIMSPNGIEAKFGSAPIAAFDSQKIRQIVQKWRKSFSEGTGDNMFSTLQRIVSFALDEGYINTHHLLRVKRRKKGNRADIIWMQPEIDLFIKKAPRYVSNLLIMATETGLRPGDLNRLCWSHIQETPNGQRRIFLKTNKSSGRNFAAVPVTPRLWDLLQTFPPDIPRFALTADGTPFKNSNSLGGAIHEWRDTLGIRSELRFYDARGTAVTRLVRAGCTIGELASHMGWSMSHAAAMLDRYARIDPEMSDGILDRLEAHKRKAGRKG